MCFTGVLLRGFGGGYLIQRVPPQADQKSNSLEQRFGEVLVSFVFFFCLFFFLLLGLVVVIRLYMVKQSYLDSLPFSLYKWWSHHHEFSLFFYLKAHKQCCLHCLNFNKGHMTMATALHWQNIISMWDTHKGESDLNTRQFRISKGQTDILTIYNIEQIKKKVAISILNNSDSKTSHKMLFWKRNVGLNLCCKV